MSVRFPLIALILLSLLNTSCKSKKTCPETTLIPTGKFINNWVYENEEMGLSIQLPVNWYLENGLGTWNTEFAQHYTKKYHKDIPLDSPMSKFDMKNLIAVENIPLKEILESKAQGPMHIFPMLEVHETEIKSEQSKRLGDPSIAFVIVVSKNQDAADDIQELINYVKPAWEKDHEMDLKKTTIKVGNSELKGFSFKPASVQNHFLTRMTFFKNYGCYDLGIIIDYATPKQLEGIKNILAGAKL
jgi:hypothetical protein